MEDGKCGSGGGRCWLVALALVGVIGCSALAYQVHQLRGQNARLRGRIAAQRLPPPREEDMSDEEVDDLAMEMAEDELKIQDQDGVSDEEIDDLLDEMRN